VDESTDMSGHSVANLLVGRLDPDKFFAPHLVSVKFLEKTNHATISRFVLDGLSV